MENRELWIKAHEMRQKHSYYMLSVNGICIGYAVSKPFDFDHWGYAVLLGMAVVSWCLGIFFGCKLLRRTSDIFFSEYHAISGPSEERELFDPYRSTAANDAVKYYGKQFSCLWLGSAAFGAAFSLPIFLRAAQMFTG